MTPLTTSAKHRQSRATHYALTRQAWRESDPHLEHDGITVAESEAPAPCPTSQRTVDSVGVVEFKGVVIVVPSPWISKSVNKRMAQFWRSHGFELRTPDNTPHPCTESYVKEWVRPCDVKLRGVRYSAKAWVVWVEKKKKELYL